MSVIEPSEDGRWLRLLLREKAGMGERQTFFKIGRGSPLRAGSPQIKVGAQAANAVRAANHRRDSSKPSHAAILNSVGGGLPTRRYGAVVRRW
jgi:hypothetical protein